MRLVLARHYVRLTHLSRPSIPLKPSARHSRSLPTVFPRALTTRLRASAQSISRESPVGTDSGGSEQDGGNVTDKGVSTLAQPALRDAALASLQSTTIQDLLGSLQRGGRLYGDAFVENAWRQLLHRMKQDGTDLPVDDPVASEVWIFFLRCRKLHASIFNYACDLRYRRGELFEPLYEVIVGAALEIESGSATQWHRSFARRYSIPRESLVKLAPRLIAADRVAAKSDELLSAFTASDLNEPIYTQRIETRREDEVLSKAVNSGREPRHEVERHDVGSQAQFAASLVRPLGSQQSGGLSDEFCARLFATRALSVETVARGLGMFAATTVGPLSLRELCIRSDCQPKMILEKIKFVESTGARFENNWYFRTIKELCVQSNNAVLERLVTSDMHPSVVEEREVLQQLLRQAVAKGDVPERDFLLTLVTLTYSKPERVAQNILLKTYAAQGNHNAVYQLINETPSEELHVQITALRFLWDSFAGSRQPGQRPQPSSRPSARQSTHLGPRDDKLTFLAALWLKIAESDPQRFGHWPWRELLKRLGMSGRFLELGLLCNRIAALYLTPPRPITPKRESENATVSWLAVRQHHPNEPQGAREALSAQQHLAEIFRPRMLEALVTWGFRDGILRSHGTGPAVKMTDSEVIPKYMQGVTLVGKLNLAGVHVQTSHVRHALRQRLWQLISPGWSKRSSNRMMVKIFEDAFGENQADVLETVVRQAERSWHQRERIFPELYELDDITYVDSSSLEQLPDLHTLTYTQRVRRRNSLFYAIFGSSPKVGGVWSTTRRNMGIKRPVSWRSTRARPWVESWAHGVLCPRPERIGPGGQLGLELRLNRGDAGQDSIN